MVAPTNHVFARAGYTLRGAFGTSGIFANIFQPSIEEDQKKSLTNERGIPGTVAYGKFGPAHCVTFIKRLDESLK